VNRGLPVLLKDSQREYVWGLGLAYSVSGSSIEVHHSDGLGSTRAVTTAAGQVESTYLTDDFGVSKLLRGANPARMQYTGEPRDSETGFVYLRARMYDPQTGQFLQRDPFAGFMPSPLSLNRFAYAYQNPVTLIDPTGYSPGNQVLQDSDCFKQLGGGHGVVISCFHFNTMIVALVWIKGPNGIAQPITIAVPMGSPGGDVGGSGASGSQSHHIATDKQKVGRWTKLFEDLFAKAGMTLQDPDNMVLLSGHAGPHSDGYHRYVYRRLTEATRGLSGADYEAALRHALKRLREELRTNPGMVRME
ncbi:MAG: RHS repeat-associated core domain-containing protein, partial [Chloroflexota bacterium]